LEPTVPNVNSNPEAINTNRRAFADTAGSSGVAGEVGVASGIAESLGLVGLSRGSVPYRNRVTRKKIFSQ
jgi:hypothetical protein